MKVQCPHCNSAMNDQYLSTHIHHVHHMILSTNTESSSLSPPPCKCPHTSHSTAASNPYILNTLVHDIRCPVPCCLAHSTDLYTIHRHLCIQHPMDQFQVISPYNSVQCPHCGILLTTLSPEHFQSQFCNWQSTRCLCIQSHVRCSVTTDIDSFSYWSRPN